MAYWTDILQVFTLLIRFRIIISQNVTNDEISTSSFQPSIDDHISSNTTESYNISTHVSYPSDGDGISTTNSLQTIPDIDKRVAAVGKVDDGVKPTTLAVGAPTTSHANLLNTTTPECENEQSFCEIMRNVLKKTKSPSSKHSGGNGITVSTKINTSPNEETLNTTRTTLGIQRTVTTLLSTLAKNYHGINTTIKPAIQNSGSTVTTKQELNRGITTPLSRLNIRTSVNRVVVSVHSSRTTTTTWVDWMREVISKSSFNTSITSRPPTKYDHKTLVEEVKSHNSTNVDIRKVNSILQQLETIMNTSTDITFEEAGKILLNVSKWKNADMHTVEKGCNIISKMVETVQSNSSVITNRKFQHVMQNLLKAIENILTSSVTKDMSISTSAVDVVVQTVEQNITSDFLILTSGGSIVLSHHVFISSVVRISTVVYHDVIGDNLGGHQNFGGAEVSSNVIAVSLDEVNQTSITSMPVNEKGAIIITLPTNIRKREKKRICSYWNFKKEGWASDGGTILGKNETHTTCMFDHLTNFAVLVLYYDDDETISVSQDNILMIMTTIGCSISITCLGMTILAFTYLKLLCRETILIHGNLSLALLCGQLVLVASDDAVGNDIACKVVAMVLHYFFLSSFTWMMVEGIALYFSCTRGLYNHGDMRMKYCFVGWAIPLVIVVISIGAEFPHYGNSERNSCWLSTDDGLIWAFMGPMLIIIMFNIFVLALVVKVFLSLEANSRKSDAARLRASIRAMIFLLPLLGITWLLSVLVPLHAAFHYLFVVGNSLQGMMIFFLHCICNEEIRKRFIEKRKKLSLTHRTFADSEMAMDIKRRKKNNSFCDVQIELPTTDRKYCLGFLMIPYEQCLFIHRRYNTGQSYPIIIKRCNFRDS